MITSPAKPAMPVTFALRASRLGPIDWWVVSLPFVVLLTVCISWVCPALNAWVKARSAVLVWAVVGFGWFCYHHQRNRTALRGWIERSKFSVWPWWLTALATLSLALWAAAVHFRKFYEFQINGVDFSIFDWMLYSTATGNFGFSPIYQVNHFGVHSTFHLLLLVPFHRWFDSALLLTSFNLIAILAAAVPLYLLSTHLAQNVTLARLCVFAYLFNPWSMRQLNGGYMPEYTFALGYFLLLYGAFTRRFGWVAVACLWLFCTKEDTPLYVCATSAAFLVSSERKRDRVVWLTVIGSGVAFFFVYTQLLQPYWLAARGVVQPGYVQFWSHYGSTKGAALLGMLRAPHRLALDIVTSN
jgi:Predicted membrane protein (DUF2079)